VIGTILATIGAIAWFVFLLWTTVTAMRCKCDECEAERK
jgi:hypothetical protein